MEATVADARKRGRAISLLCGATFFALGLLFLLLSAACSFYIANGPCPHLQDSLSVMAYVGVIFIALFCCAPCFALNEEELVRVCSSFRLLILSGFHSTSW